MRQHVARTGMRSKKQICGDVEAYQALVLCEVCGHLRQHDRPHGYMAPEYWRRIGE